MADYASDITSEDDINVAAGELDVTFSRRSHGRVTRVQANDLRTAYLSGGWTNLRAAWASIDDRAPGWLDSMTQAEKDAIIYHVSSRGPRPAVP